MGRAKGYGEVVKGRYLMCYENVSRTLSGGRRSLRYLSEVDSDPLRRFERASFPRRFLALLIDWTVALLTAALVIPSESSDLAPSLLRLGIFFLQVGLLTSLGGASLGQRLVGIRVVSLYEQYYVSSKIAFIRTALIVAVLPAVIIDSEGRGLHERITQTDVVRVR